MAKKRSSERADGTRRFRPREIAALDLSIHDPRIVWAKSARASSAWSDSYAPSTACGPPCVYPEGGDVAGTWLAEGSDAAPWLELELPEVQGAAAIIVCETCGPGAVRELRDAERDVVLWSAAPEAIGDSREARLLHVPLPPGTPAPRKLRLEVAPQAFGSEYHEIDAVGLLLVPLATLLADAPSAGAVRHRRYAPSEVEGLALRGDWRIVWATRARASSEWSSRYAAKEAVGPPNVFPRGGDLDRTWLSQNADRQAWIELEFPREHERIYGFIALETCGAGAICRATDERGETLWQAPYEKSKEREARLLHVRLDEGPPPEKLRLWVSPAVRDYREIDGVALLAAPFEELSAPAPPPPLPRPKPIPGAPEGGFTMLEGVLLGATPERPFVHATLREPTRARAVNGGGPLRLRLSSGDEVALEVGRTTIYGGRLDRARGTWEDARARLPVLAAPFDERIRAEDARVVLEGRRLTTETRVHVAGVPAVRDGARGFRDSARGSLETLEAVAISSVPLMDTSFATNGTDDFERGATRLGLVIRHPHPLRRWAIGAAVAAAACTSVAAGVVGVAATSRELEAVPAGWMSLTILLAGFACTLALEALGRLHHVAGFVRGTTASVTDRRVAFGRPLVTVVTSGTVFMLMAMVALGAVTTSDAPFDSMIRVPSMLGGAFARLRLAVWQWTAAPTLVRALRVLLARSARSELGARGRFTGPLAAGPTFTRSDRFVVRSEHLGVDHVTDDRGNTVARDRWRSWTERVVRARGGVGVRVILSDGRIAETWSPAWTTDVGQRVLPGGPRLEYARFESAHEEGDEATIVGAVESTVEGEGGSSTVTATHVVLGELRELRRRVLVQTLALAGLLAIVGSAALAAWL